MPCDILTVRLEEVNMLCWTVGLSLFGLAGLGVIICLIGALRAMARRHLYDSADKIIERVKDEN